MILTESISLIRKLKRLLLTNIKLNFIKEKVRFNFRTFFFNGIYFTNLRKELVNTMNMKKILTFFTAATMVLGMFSGCGNGGAESSVSVENSSETGSEDEMSSEIEKTPETDEEWTEAMMKKAVVSYGNTDMMQKVIKKAQSGEKVTIAYLGGSITEGISAGAEDCYAKLSYKHFAEKYGTGDNVGYCNAGLSGTPSKLGIFRLDRDVLSSDPDICFIEFAVNDSNDPEHQGAYESIVRTLLGKNIAPVLLFSVTKDDYSAQDYMKEIGEAYDLPMISYCDALRYLFENSRMEWSDFSDDSAHPNKNGHKLVASMIDYYFDTVTDVESQGEYHMPETELHSLLSVNAHMQEGDVLKPVSLGSWEEGSSITTFTNGWSHILGENEPIVFEVKSKYLYLIYKEVKSGNLGKAHVKISADGKVLDEMDIDPISTYGWGNPQVTNLEMQSEETTYRVEISMKKGDEDKQFEILGFGYVNE